MEALDSNLVFGYGNGRFNPEDKVELNTMYCKFGQISRTPVSFRDECVRTAELVSSQIQSLGRVPYILLSGGLDSEVVLKSFIESGADFRAITFRYPNGENAHEISYVQEFLKRHKVQHQFYDLDIRTWGTSAEATNLFNESYCSYFEMVPHMKLMLDVYERGGAPVLGNGEALLYKNPDRSWSYIEYEYDFAWYRFARKNKILGAMGFFQHTPEITFSMLNEPQMLELAEGKNKMANVTLQISRMVKYAVYRQHWPDLQRRPKHDGSEFMKPFVESRADALNALRPITYDDKWLVPVSEFYDSVKS